MRDSGLGKKGYFNEGYNSLNTDNGEDRALLYNNTCARCFRALDVRNFVNDSKRNGQMQTLAFPFPEDAEAREKGVPQNVERSAPQSVMDSPSICWKEDGFYRSEKLDACYVLATQHLMMILTMKSR